MTITYDNPDRVSYDDPNVTYDGSMVGATTEGGGSGTGGHIIDRLMPQGPRR